MVRRSDPSHVDLFSHNSFYYEYLIYNEYGSECQRLVHKLNMKYPNVQGVYSRRDDELIIMYPDVGMFYLIPAKRDGAKLLGHGFYYYKDNNVILSDKRRVWVFGGRRLIAPLAEFSGAHHYTIETSIYDLE